MDDSRNIFELIRSESKIRTFLGFVLNLFFITIPQDLIRWAGMTKKCVKDKVVVITGGASGIGKRVAEIMGEKYKAVIVILDLNKDVIDSVVKELKEKQIKAYGYQCNVTNKTEVDKVAQDIYSTIGDVDIIICNAAIVKFGYCQELSTDDLRNSFDVNVHGVLNTIQTFLPKFEQNNHGHIVAMSSIAGHYGETYGLAYCPSKFAVRSIMECLQMEFRDRGLDGIKCTTLFPAFVRTPMIEKLNFRPVSRFVPYMSIDYCARVTVDSILMDRVVCYIPRWIFFMGLFKGMMPYHVQKAARAFMGFQFFRQDNEKKENASQPSRTILFSPSAASPLPSQPTISPFHPHSRMVNYFKSPAWHWFVIIPVGLAFAGIVYYNVDLIPHQYLGPVGEWMYDMGTKNRDVTFWINILAWLAHAGEALYALYLCDKRGYSYDSTFKWVLQTFFVGFPSLMLLTAHKQPKKRRKIN